MLIAADSGDFWQWFVLLLVFMPLVVVWVYIVYDVFRRTDLSGARRAGWILVVLLIPWFGALAYVFLRPARATEADREELQRRERSYIARWEASAPERTAGERDA